MTIMTDRWITQQNRKPHYALMKYGIRLGWLSPPYTPLEQGMIQHYLYQSQSGEGVMIDPSKPYIVEVDGSDFTPMIEPSVSESVRVVDGEKVMSFGPSSYGYDVRLADDFKIFTNINSTIIDPKSLSDKTYIDHKGPYCIIPPNSYILGHTIETFNIPDNVTCVCLGKSTYARAGAIVNVTPIEAGFKGQVVIEISNATNLPLKVYANEGIAQFLFFRGEERCDVSYSDRSGKYQNQMGITLPKV